jgi:phospholipase C
MADLAHNRLPQVSWLLASLNETEHPGFSAAVAGEMVTRQIVEALVSHPKIWQKTALFITWDENGGFFDHVPPPVAPKGTAGEFLTVSPLPSSSNSFAGDAEGIAGPIGLGFRVPMLVVSPFSTGGLVSSDTFDHTSTLRFLETRFRARVPNLTSWRRKHTGDLTSAFNFAAKPRMKAPVLPKVPGSADVMCAAPASTTQVSYSQQPFPKQARGSRRRPSGIVK